MKILIAVNSSACSMKATKHIAVHLEWFRDTPDIYLPNVQVPIGAYRTRGLLNSDDVANFYHKETKAACALLHQHDTEPGTFAGRQALYRVCAIRSLEDDDLGLCLALRRIGLAMGHRWSDY